MSQTGGLLVVPGQQVYKNHLLLGSTPVLHMENSGRKWQMSCAGMDVDSHTSVQTTDVLGRNYDVHPK